MQIETRTTQGSSFELLIITADPQDREIRLTPDIAFAYRSVRVDSDLPVVVEPGATMFGLHAPRSDVSCAGDLTLRDLSAKSYRGDGHLYVLIRMSVEGDVLLSGELKGERHFPYEIGGDLVCDGLDVDGRVRVGGDLITPWEDTRELTVSGDLRSPEEIRQAGGVVRARPGLATDPEVLDRLTDGVSPAAQARGVLALSPRQWVRILTEADLPGGVAGPLFAEAITVAEAFADPTVPQEHGFMEAVYAAWGEAADAQTRDLAARALMDFALGTHPVGGGLAEARAVQVRQFDNALAFLSTYQDPDDRHYGVEEVKGWLDASGVPFAVSDTYEEAVFLVTASLADPSFADADTVLNAVEARIAASGCVNAQTDATRIREAVARGLGTPAAPEPV